MSKQIKVDINCYHLSIHPMIVISRHPLCIIERKMMVAPSKGGFLRFMDYNRILTKPFP